jgi:hypothetical protein
MALHLSHPSSFPSFFKLFVDPPEIVRRQVLSRQPQRMSQARRDGPNPEGAVRLSDKHQQIANLRLQGLADLAR